MMDIATLSWRGVQLAWQSLASLCRPEPGVDPEWRFNTAFGGFLNTCGFDHIRQPADGRPLHGSAPFTLARLTAYGEDWDAAVPILFCEGEAVCWTHDGFGYRFRRRIEAPIGGHSLAICDRVTVIGTAAAPIVALYHFNLGYPLIEQSTIALDGRMLVGRLSVSEERPVPASLYPTSGAQACCSVRGKAATVAFRWDTEGLPWLQLWRDLRPRSAVAPIEPCTIGRREDGRNAPVPMLALGTSQAFAIGIDIADSLE